MNVSWRRSWVLVALLCGACGSSGSSGDTGSGGSSGSSGGSSGTGGASPGSGTGGAKPVGSGGNVVATGGTTTVGTGGTSTSTGGETATGGTAASTGGTTSNGGSTANGGSSPTGGKPGGTAGTSGSSGGAGGTVISFGGSTGTDPGTDGDGDIKLTSYPVDPDLVAGKNPAGKRFNFNQTGSKLYPATQSRAISVYIPAKFKDTMPAPVMVVMDGAGSQFLRVNTALDNLTASTNPARVIPAFVEIAVANGERSIELDTMSDLWARYIDEEVFPAVEANAAIKAAYPNFKITKDPEGRGAIGCSSGGSAAVIMAWFRPVLFRRTIGYDASLVNLQSSPMYPLGAWELHSDMALILNSPVEPIRLMYGDNEMDNGAGTGAAGAKDWLLAGTTMAADLKMKGYHYRWVEGMGAKHCSDAKVQQTDMANSLVWVWRGYVPNGM